MISPRGLERGIHFPDIELLASFARTSDCPHKLEGFHHQPQANVGLIRHARVIFLCSAEDAVYSRVLWALRGRAYSDLKLCCAFDGHPLGRTAARNRDMHSRQHRCGVRSLQRHRQVFSPRIELLESRYLLTASLETCQVSTGAEPNWADESLPATPVVQAGYASPWAMLPTVQRFSIARAPPSPLLLPTRIAMWIAALRCATR